MKRHVATAVIVALVTTILVAAQATAHYRSPSNNKRLKHDLKHLDGFLTGLVGNSFVDGKARVLRGRAVRDSDGETTMVKVPGMGSVKLVREVAFSDCSVNWVNQSGQVVTRNGIGRANSGPPTSSPPTTDARIDPGEEIGLTSANGQLQSGYAEYHIATVNLRKMVVVNVAVNEGVPPRPTTGCAATVVVTYTTI